MNPLMVLAIVILAGGLPLAAGILCAGRASPGQAYSGDGDGGCTGPGDDEWAQSRGTQIWVHETRLGAGAFTDGDAVHLAPLTGGWDLPCCSTPPCFYQNPKLTRWTGNVTCQGQRDDDWPG